MTALYDEMAMRVMQVKQIHWDLVEQHVATQFKHREARQKMLEQDATYQFTGHLIRGLIDEMRHPNPNSYPYSLDVVKIKELVVP